MIEHIPDPVQHPGPHNILHALVPQELPNTVKIGGIDINPERHDGFKFEDDDTGEKHEIIDLQSDPEDPEIMLGTLVAKSESDTAKLVKMKRRIHESRPFQFLFVDHKTATEATATAVTISAIAVGSLVIRHRHKKS